jgi:outer membrane lipoprotein SlyB
VVDIDKGGKVKGLAQLGIELSSLNTSDGQKVQVQTERFVRQAQDSKMQDAAKVGGGAALGAIIGAIAGGGKGAAIGAGVGGAAGAGDVALTRGKAAQLPVETKVSFRLREPVTITERLR